MVSFCNRLTVFLPISGHRYRTEFRFKISTGEPDVGGRVLGGHRAKLPRPKQDHPHPSRGSSSTHIRRWHMLVPPGCAGECATIHTPYPKPFTHPHPNPGVIQSPYCGYVTPRKVRSAAAAAHAHTHTTSARNLKTSQQQSSVSFQATDNNRRQQSWPTQSNNAGTCYLNSFRQHVLTETNHTDMPT